MVPVKLQCSFVSARSDWLMNLDVKCYMIGGYATELQGHVMQNRAASQTFFQHLRWLSNSSKRGGA